MSRGGVLTLAGLLLLSSGLWLGAEAMTDDAPWAVVERRDLVLTVPVEGELRAVESVVLGPPQIPSMWQFKIESIATEGVDVAAGDPILSFDATQIQRDLRLSMAERDAAEKELEKKITDLELERRALELRLAEAEARQRKARFLLEVPSDVTASHDLEKARIDRDLAQLEIDYVKANLEHMDVRDRLEVGTLREKRDQAAAKVEELQRHLEMMVVTAPRAGTVILREDWNGEKPKVGDQAWRMRKLVEIPDLSRMEAEAEVAEADSGRLREGQLVTFRLDAYPDREYRGTIAQIHRAVQRKSSANPSKVVKVVLEIAESDPDRLRPGMRLRGAVEIERLENVLSVPEEAVDTGPEGSFITVPTLFGARRVEPELGARDDRYFQVVSGLDEGDRVRTGGGGP